MTAPIIKHGITTVGAGSSGLTLSFLSDENAGTPAYFPSGNTVTVIGIPDWATSWRVDTNDTPDESGTTILFGTEPGGYGGNFYWQAVGR